MNSVIELYWRSISSDFKKGYIERIVLPDGQVILFDHEKGNIDFEPLQEYIGTVCYFYRNGEFDWEQKLKAVKTNEEGFQYLEFEPIDEE
jgi:hypothetical protein